MTAEFGLAQSALDEAIENRSFVSPPMFFTASNSFWPSSRTPSTTRSETDVAFLSSRTRTTVPSGQTLSTLHPQPTYTPEICYAFLIAGTGIPAILRFTEPRKFQLVK